jgi:TrmH family RNA methyltransferase
MTITSLTNPRIKEVVKLRDHKARKESGLTVVEGVREVQCAHEADVKFKEVYFCRDFLAAAQEKQLAKVLSKKGAVIEEVSAEVFNKISYGERQEGVLAVCVAKNLDISEIKLKETAALLVIVEKAEKPGNLGAILRTCDAAGVDALIICDGKTDIYNPNVIRASLGTVFSVPVVQATNEKTLAFLKQNRITVCASSPNADLNYSYADFRKSVAIAMGSEEEGLSKFWFKSADHKVKIPMYGKADSLNLSVSTAILVYEAVRQRNLFSL